MDQVYVTSKINQYSSMARQSLIPKDHHVTRSFLTGRNPVHLFPEPIKELYPIWGTAVGVRVEVTEA